MILADNTLMSSVDRAWLEMDEPRNPMVVAGLIQLDGGVAPARLRKTLINRLLRYPRFRKWADDTARPAQWRAVESMNLGYHVHVIRLPKAATEQQLRREVALALADNLDRSRPLWRLFIFCRRGGPTTLLFRAHHALADGVALVRVLLNCSDAAVQRRPKLTIPHEAQESTIHGGPLGGLIAKLSAANRVLQDLSSIALDDLHHPDHLREQLSTGRKALAAVQRVLALPQNNPEVLRQPLSGHRVVAWTTGLPFAPVRAAASSLGVKINDVFLTALAGALGQDLRERGIALGEQQNLRISIPVNLRDHDRDDQLGNCFGLVLLDLPIGIQEPLPRLRLVAERMRLLKQSPEAQSVLMGLAAAGHLPVPWEKKLVTAIGGKAVAVVSNLPGPMRLLRISGARVQSLVFWPPQAGGIGVGISLFSYADRVSIGVSADTALMPQPAHLLERFEEELSRVIALAPKVVR